MLAQAILAAAETNIANFIWISVVLAIILAAATAAVLIFRRYLRRNGPADGRSGPAFELEELRQLRRDQKITDAEYKILSEKIFRET